MSAGDVARLRTAYGKDSFNMLLDELDMKDGEKAKLSEWKAALRTAGVHQAGDLRRSEKLMAAKKAVPLHFLQSVLLQLPWHPDLMVTRRDDSGDSRHFALPSQAGELFVFWMEACGREDRAANDVLLALKQIYLHLNPTATLEMWGETSKNASNVLSNADEAQRALAQDFVGQLLPSMPFLRKLIPMLSHKSLAAFLCGLRSPKPLTQTLQFHPAQRLGGKSRPAVKPLPRLPLDLVRALGVLYADFPTLMATELAAAQKPLQSRRVREYYAHLAAVLEEAIETETSEKRRQQLRAAQSTLREKHRVALKALPPTIQAVMASWKVAYARSKAREAHVARVMQSLPSELMYSCREPKMVAGFWEQDFFARMLVWWRLNEMYDLQFPDFHRTVGKGFEMLPKYKAGLKPDELDRSI